LQPLTVDDGTPLPQITDMVMNAILLRANKALSQGQLDLLQHLKCKNGFFWLDVEDASSDDLKEFTSTLAIDLETATWLANPGKRARIEIDRQRVRISTCAINREGRLCMVRALYEPSAWLLTVHAGAGIAMDRARRFFSSLPDDQPVDWRRTIFIVLNELLAGFELVLEGLDESLDKLEIQIFESPRHDLLQELFGLRQQLLTFYRALIPHRDELRGFGMSAAGMMADHMEQQLHEYCDRVAGLVGDIGDKRQRVNDAIQAYSASVSNVQARVIDRLTIISAVFLPLTFLTGFFGMNFQWMIDHIGSAEAFLLLGIGLFAAVLAFMLVVFWREGWIGKDRQR
jgi:magnesium transporter